MSCLTRRGFVHLTVTAMLALPGLALRESSAAEAFNPSAIPGCVLWLDGRDAATLTLDDAGRVSRWLDKSGRDNHVGQARDDQRPQLIAGEATLPGVRFAGTHWLHTTRDLTHTSDDPRAGVSIFVVFETAEEHPLRLMGLTGSGGTQKNKPGLSLAFNDRHVVTQNNGPAFTVADGNEHAINLGGDDTSRKRGLTGTLAPQYSTLLAVTADPEAARLYAFGDELPVKEAPPLNADHWAWGAGWAVGATDRQGGDPFAGTIAEVLVFDRVLESDEKSRIETSLREKYALAPPSHAVYHPAAEPIELARADAVTPDGVLLNLADNKVFASRDGKTWEEMVAGKPDPALPHVPPSGGLLAVTSNGTLIQITRDRASFVKLTYENRKFTSDKAQSLVYAMRSTDGGRTWTDAQLLQEGYCGAMRDIIVTSRGHVVASLQVWHKEHERHVTTVFASTDEGKTWKSSMLDNGIGWGLHDGMYESTVTELNDGRLWLIGRTSLGVFWQSFSEDGGLTWAAPTATDISAAGYPADLIRLKSGRFAMVWNRYYPDGYEGRDDLVNLTAKTWLWGTTVTSRLNRQLSIMFTDDDGRTWTEPEVIVETRQDFIGPCYPLVLEKEPGEIYIWARDIGLRIRESDFFGSAQAARGPQEGK